MYEVEVVTDKRVKKGKLEYYVKWKNYNEWTWEPLAHLENVKDLIEDFERKQANTSDNKTTKRRHKSMSSVGRVLSSERFAQVETATGSGRKITIKCGDKSKLKSKDIINLLDDEADEEVEKPVAKSKVPEKKPRSRRASVSCTTPAKGKGAARKRPASEVKKKGRGRQVTSDEDDDFVPAVRASKTSKGKKPVSSWSDTDESSSGSDFEADSPIVSKKSASASRG